MTNIPLVRCPTCSGQVSMAATVCPQCGQPLTPASPEAIRDTQARLAHAAAQHAADQKVRAKNSRMMMYIFGAAATLFVGWCSVATVKNMSSSGNLDGVVSDIHAVGSAQVEFTLTVTNENDHDIDDVSCTIEVGDGSYSGYDIFDVGSIAAGESSSASGAVTVTNDGATQVVSGTAECKNG